VSGMMNIHGEGRRRASARLQVPVSNLTTYAKDLSDVQMQMSLSHGKNTIC